MRYTGSSNNGNNGGRRTTFGDGGRGHRDRGTRREQVRPTRGSDISVTTAHENEVGRVVAVSGVRESTRDPYFVVHLWTNNDRTASRVEGYYENQTSALEALEGYQSKL